MGKSLECDLILFLKIAGSAASPQSNDDATADAPFFATRPTNHKIEVAAAAIFEFRLEAIMLEINILG